MFNDCYTMEDIVYSLKIIAEENNAIYDELFSLEENLDFFLREEDQCYDNIINAIQKAQQRAEYL